MLQHIPLNWTVISNTGNVVTCQTFRSKDEVQSVGKKKKKKSLKCDILNLWLMIKQKIKLSLLHTAVNCPGSFRS